MKTLNTQTAPQKKYTLIDEEYNSVYETTSFNKIKKMANTVQLLKIYKVFWIGERIDNYTVSVWHEYHKSGVHNAVICEVKSIRLNHYNLQTIYNDVNYYSNRKEIKKELMQDLKLRRKNTENKEHFNRKIKELEDIFKTKHTDKLYVCNSTGTTVKKVGNKFRAITSFGRPEVHINAVTIKHEICEDTVGCTYEYRLSELTILKR